MSNGLSSFADSVYLFIQPGKSKKGIGKRLKITSQSPSFLARKKKETIISNYRSSYIPCTRNYRARASFLHTQHLQKHSGHGSQAVLEDERPVVSHFYNNLIINVSPPSSQWALPSSPVCTVFVAHPKKSLLSLLPFRCNTRICINIGVLCCRRGIIPERSQVLEW